MVISTVAGIGLAAGLIAIPAGVALHQYVLPVMGHAVQTGLPPAVLDVYRASELILLALSGLAIALAGALARPAGQPGPAPHPRSAPNNPNPHHRKAEPASR
jgi:putative ABC transport system permease protein